MPEQNYKQFLDNDIKPMFASNDKQEAITAGNDIREGIPVVRVDERGLKETVYLSSYKADLGIVD